MTSTEGSTATTATTKRYNGDMTLESLEFWSWWFNVTVVLLTALLAIAGFFAWKFSSELGTRKDDALSRFQIESSRLIAQANERVAQAEARVAEANKGIEGARRETAVLSREAALSSERTGKLELETETQRKLTAEATERGKQLELELEKTRLELAKLKAPRTLTPEQQERIAHKLRQFSETPFDCFVSQDTEPIDLMLNISDALTRAGWVHKPIEGHAAELNVRGKPAAGLVILTGIEVQIHISRLDDWSKSVHALVAALSEEGIAATLKAFNHKNEHPNAIHIKIGKKP